MSFVPTAQEAALYQWAQSVLGASVPVVYSRQPGAPRPKQGAFVTLYVVSEMSQEHPSQRLTDTAHADGDYVLELRAQQRGRVQVDVYGAGHRELMRNLVDSLEVPLVQEANRGRGVAVTFADTIRDSSQQRGQRWEGRSTCDFSFTWQRATEHRGEAVETVSTTQYVLEEAP